MLFKDIVCGILGQAGYLISIPILLYLFYIHTFSGKRPVKMRSICLVCFVVCSGCIAHLVLNPQHVSTGIKMVSDLYTGGVEGTTGGFLCGGLAALIKLLCGSVFSYIVLVPAAVLTLLGGMQITIPSIIRAIQNRPRPDWEEEEPEEKQEPAAVVVNHIANKRIEYIERKRQLAEEQTEKKPTPAKRASDIFSQIEGDVDDPVAAAGTVSGKGSPDTQPEIIPIQKKRKDTPQSVPTVSQKEDDVQERVTFPELNLDADPVALNVPSTTEVAKEKVTAQDALESAQEVAVEIAQAETEEKPLYRFPPIDLLKLPKGTISDGTAEMKENTARLNETLASFRIEAHIINVTRGPSVTRYEVELEKGVRLNKLTTAADDIALSLGATGVRIAAIPGKISVVGIEVPNRDVNTVSLREVIDSTEFDKAKSKSSFAVGKDIGGSCIVGNIAKLPHMLIAGTTGSGKSVCMNSIIISLLYKATPAEVKLIMIDPKMVELVNYNGIPHLLILVVTDPKKAAGSLQWAVTEMMRRYRSMSDAGVRDLESYNSIMEAQNEPEAKLAQIVVVIDELADLMLVAAKEVEESICRIAQMGRAAGIHLVIATQRPSADVITGLMKANIPSRIAFSVASAMESRIILDTQGAEKLVGKGDMLYAPIGSGKPRRVQGCFVSDAEVEAVAAYVKSNFSTEYDETVMQEIETKAKQTGSKPATASDLEPTGDELAGDEMLPAAVDVILETGQASVSMLQRRLKLGYARAARIVDEMEEKGIVGPFVGSKPRTILVTKEQWELMKNGQSPQMNFEDLTEGTDDCTDPEE
ncbi:MAG: DNA translocase FtsK [Oscillospiraceae bacterium]|nr:DNA translocase FtsK [Oscillospiraceae bacterium]